MYHISIIYSKMSHIKNQLVNPQVYNYPYNTDPFCLIKDPNADTWRQFQI